MALGGLVLIKFGTLFCCVTLTKSFAFFWSKELNQTLISPAAAKRPSLGGSGFKFGEPAG